jgi:hypothetical protein
VRTNFTERSGITARLPQGKGISRNQATRPNCAGRFHRFAGDHADAAGCQSSGKLYPKVRFADTGVSAGNEYAAAERRCGHGRVLPVSRRSASRYLSRVFLTTAAGSSGPGAFLFQVSVSR